MTTIPALIYQDIAFGGSVSVVTLDASVDTQYIVALNGTNQQGEPAIATHAVVDNTGNNGSVYVDYGFARYSVAPYTRKTFPILADQLYIRFQLATKTVPVTFTTFDPGTPDEVNQVATSAGGTGGGGSGSSTNTFDPVKHDGQITLSSGNLISTTTYGGWAPVLSLNGHTTGKYYIEETMTSGTYTMLGVGLNNAQNTTSASGGFIGGDNSTGFSYGSGGQGIVGGGTGLLTNLPGSMPSWGVGDTACMAIDLDASLVWFKKAGGLWNNNAAGDPAAGVQGIGFAALAAGTRFVGASQRASVCSINFGASLFVNSAPSGFGIF